MKSNNWQTSVHSVLIAAILFPLAFTVYVNAKGIEDEVVENKKSDEVYELTLQYDDRYAFQNFSEVDLTGYLVKSITTEKVNSYQVIEGTTTADKDTDVITLNSSSDGLIATGVGKASIIFCNKDGNADGDEKYITISVTVEPAVLTVMLIAGQSNAEGLSSSVTGNHPEDSIVCEEGEVYSTYAPSTASHGRDITGIDSMPACSASDASSFVAGSLTGNISINGSALTYPLDSLTQNGDGKTGMDSGLAYKWNCLTGDKVWVINAAWSGSSIQGWIPGGDQYERALSIFKFSLITVKAEIKANHYTEENTLLFWLQGEADSAMTSDNYISNFKKMYYGFESSELDISYYGIIVVRASSGSYVNSDDIVMTGPRIAQYLLGNDGSYPKIYVVSNANEQWVSDRGVSDYFRGEYGDFLDYPLRSDATISSIPTGVEQIHGDIHYSQVGHNENGLTAAETMYQIVQGTDSSKYSVSWYDSSGNKLSGGIGLSILMDGGYDYIPVVDPLFEFKKFRIVF